MKRTKLQSYGRYGRYAVRFAESTISEDAVTEIYNTFRSLTNCIFILIYAEDYYRID